MENLLEVNNLQKYFIAKNNKMFSKEVNYIKAVEDVSLTLKKGETLGLVGESGCGKSTTGRLILNLLNPTKGEVLFEGQDISKLGKNEMREIRKDMQLIFQDPYASLNPRMTVEDIITEPMKNYNILDKVGRKKRVYELLETVGLSKDQATRYPHEFSGGQRQRIGIARALSVNPKLIVCDEPVSALDVSIQAQTINLLKDLQEEFGLTYLFIAHDLSVVKHISDRVAVMYLGLVVEIADYKDLYESPKHPYTQALLSAIPRKHPSEKRTRIVLEGDVPSPMNPPSGCRFNPRCRYATDICSKEKPEYKDCGNGHLVACHNIEM